MKPDHRKTKTCFYLAFAVLVLHGGLSYGQNNTFPSDGNVGIGTTSPADKLHVKNSAVNSIATILLENDARRYSVNVRGDQADQLYISDETAGEARIILDASGNVGIGTYNPTSKLHVEGHTKVTGKVTVDDNVGIGTTSPAAKLHVKNSAVNSIATILLENDARRYSVNVRGDQADQLYISDETAGEARIILDASGNVGIGATGPTSKLHVAGDAKVTGNVTVDGNIAAKYQDVAEWVRAGTALEPGTVVVIDPAKDDQVLPASQSYDTRVAGVVSAQPGVILGEPGTDKVKVAHGGRVKVKADARFGSIQIGDLLVSSETLGYAMRSAPVEVNGISLHRPGTIVGKALEPLREGQGEILVLLTLQ